MQESTSGQNRFINLPDFNILKITISWMDFHFSPIDVKQQVWVFGLLHLNIAVSPRFPSEATGKDQKPNRKPCGALEVLRRG